MTLALPSILQRPTPNYSPVLIRPDLLILHMMEGGYEGSVAWLCQRQAGASAHLCMSEDGTEVTQLVPLSMKAWGQCAFNGRGISLEIPGFTAQGIPQERWRAAATIFGWLSRAYAIPVQWAKDGVGRGLCQHHDLGAAGGGHVDCSGVGSLEWLAFVDMVRQAADAFAQAPLPPFALHGVAGPHEIVAPPAVAPERSHAGAARNEPGDGAAHSTGSGYPQGSVADWQSRLNQAGTSPPLVVDGWLGPLTRSAIEAFQARQELPVDGEIGPATSAALAAATFG